MKLYEITQTLLDIEARIAASEGGSEALDEALKDWDVEFQEKIVNLAGLMDTLKAEQEAVATVIKRRQEYAKSLGARIASLEAYTMKCMEAVQRTEVKTPDILVRIKTGTGAVEVTDPSKLPSDYRLFVPSSWDVDKAGIRAALLAKKKVNEPTEMPGAHLVFSKKLEIK